MILDHPVISERYFFPRSDSVKDPVIVECDGADLHCLKHYQHHDAPILLHFHGNGEVVADYEGEIANAFSKCGLNVFFAEYRGYGGSTGTPLLGTMLDDVSTIMQSLNVPPEQVIVLGRSVGSIYAIEAAHRFPNIKGLIIESGIAELHQRLSIRIRPEELGLTSANFESSIQKLISHQAKLNNYQGHLLLLHTRHDGMVELEHAEKNHAWANSKNKDLTIFEHGDHNSIMGVNWKSYFQRISDFVSQTEIQS